MSIWFWIGLGVVALLILIPLGMLAWTGWGIMCAFLDHRRDRAAKQQCVIDGLGRFERGVEPYWTAVAADGLSLTIVTAGDPPTDAQIAAFRRFLEMVRAHVQAARAWLEDLDGDDAPPVPPNRLELIGVRWRGEGAFEVVLTDLSDDASEWVCTVRFQGGVPSDVSYMH
jgi:hypothetical protein